MQNLIEICEQVAQELGKGFSECVYQEAICVLLQEQHTTYSKEHVLPKMFHGVNVGFMRADITLNESVIECKAVNDLPEGYLPQIVVYLEILNLPQGIFVNFNQNPSKPLLQLYTVTKTKEDMYFFEDYYNKTTLTLDTKGVKIIIDTKQQELDWINENIVYCKGNNLIKKECKELYEKMFKKKNSNDFIKAIEEFCGESFKDRQKDGVKHNCINDYTIKASNNNNI
jgi:GxxExxY protein